VSERLGHDQAGDWPRHHPGRLKFRMAIKAADAMYFILNGTIVGCA
jgi:hypothetical protein